MYKKVVASILSVITVFSLLLPVAANAAENAETAYCPSIVIPGVFQSDVRYYDEDGNEMTKADGTTYEMPFYLDETKEIVKLALKEALIPISKMLITQHDKDKLAAKAIADVLGQTIGGKVSSDSNGNLTHNIRAVEYNTNAANLSEEDRNNALSTIPLYDYVDIAGLDKLYYFSYVSFDNIQRLAARLYNLIQTAKSESGADKVNLIPISQGGTIYVALMQYYKDNGKKMSDDVHRVCFIVPAADGTALLGDIYRYGLLDDDDALYGYMIPSLMNDDQEWIGYLVNIILRYMPNADVNSILDEAVFELINGYLKYSTCMWAFIPSKDYPACRDMYLSGEEDAYIREQTDWYYNAQLMEKEYILQLQSEGVEFFDVVDYNYPLYKICDSWDQTNADGIINTDSESFGATSPGVDTPFPEDYVQANTYCSDPSHNHLDGERILDASTGVLCESTFYFKGQDHERTADNDVIIRLATKILTDDTFLNVYSDPAFPQFNYARNSKRLHNLYNAWVDRDKSGLSETERKELETALSNAKTALDSTVMPTEEFDAVYDELYSVTYKIENGKVPKNDVSLSIKFITRFFKKISDILLNLFGGKGFSDILLFR